MKVSNVSLFLSATALSLALSACGGGGTTNDEKPEPVNNGAVENTNGGDTGGSTGGGNTGSNTAGNLALKAKVLAVANAEEESPRGNLIDGKLDTKILTPTGNFGQKMAAPDGSSQFIPGSYGMYVYLGEKSDTRKIKRIVLKGKMPWAGTGNYNNYAYPLPLKLFFNLKPNAKGEFDSQSSIDFQTEPRDEYSKNRLVDPKFVPYAKDCIGNTCEYKCETYTVTPAAGVDLSTATYDNMVTVDQVECILNKPASPNAIGINSAQNSDIWTVEKANPNFNPQNPPSPNNQPNISDKEAFYISELEIYEE